MLRSTKFGLAFALAASLFAFDTGGAIGPGAAWAQTAKNLKCKQCVKSGAIKKGAVKFNRLQPKVQDRITDLESATQALESTTQSLESTIQNLESAVMERMPFYVTLDTDNAEQTLATNGALELFARCRVDFPSNSDQLQIIATSSIDGWHLSSGGGPFNAGDEEIIIPIAGPSTGESYSNEVDGISVVAPDGSYLAIDYETTGLGLNIFGHECFTVGNVFLITGTP